MDRRDKLAYWLAQRIPRRVRMWVVVQAAAQVSIKYPDREMTSFTPAFLVRHEMGNQHETVTPKIHHAKGDAPRVVPGA